MTADNFNIETNNITISAIIPWGKPGGVERSISSALNQSKKVEDIIVIINGSTSHEQEKSIIEKYKSTTQIKLLRLNNCNNANIARNIGLLFAKTDVVAFLDSDDWWDETHIEESIKELKVSNSALVYSGMRVINSDNTTSERYAKNYLDSGGIRNYLLSYLPAPTPSLVVIRKYALKIMWDWELRRHQDYDFIARFCDKYKASYKQKITVNVDWSENKRNICHKDCFRVLKSWKDLTSPRLYRNHYVNLTKSALSNRNPIFFRKAFLALIYKTWNLSKPKS